MNSSLKKKSASSGGRSDKNGVSGQKNLFQGIKIDNDPLEREIYVRCPACNNKVFDSGLENQLW